MVSAVKKGGIVIFTINEKLLNENTDKGTGYSKAIQKLTDSGTWSSVHDAKFVNFKSSSATSNNKQWTRLLVFQKN